MRPSFLVTAGPTREHLDPVRFLSNPSTGRMGFALARAARDAGARVTLVAGPVSLRPPAGVGLVRVRSAEEMRREVMRRYRDADVVIMAAAVSDYRPRRRLGRKMKKGAPSLAVPMVRTADILAGLGRRKGGRILVGFAAETGDPAAGARRKLREKNLDLVVGNDVSRGDAGFGSDRNRAVLVSRDGPVGRLPLMRKERLAAIIVRRCLAMVRRPQPRTFRQPRRYPDKPSTSSFKL
ncbi:MAG: phosphopantothenoylcysteine decarboxylase [bacterium]|nr:phosphopantothenoylcysteine decarboxylase [bacterium]